MLPDTTKLTPRFTHKQRLARDAENAARFDYPAEASSRVSFSDPAAIGFSYIHGLLCPTLSSTQTHTPKRLARPNPSFTRPIAQCKSSEC